MKESVHWILTSEKIKTRLQVSNNLRITEDREAEARSHQRFQSRSGTEMKGCEWHKAVVSPSTVCINNLECGVIGNVSEALPELRLPLGQRRVVRKHKRTGFMRLPDRSRSIARSCVSGASSSRFPEVE